jgi:hypothetical protein
MVLRDDLAKLMTNGLCIISVNFSSSASHAPLRAHPEIDVRGVRFHARDSREQAGGMLNEKSPRRPPPEEVGEHEEDK